MAKSAVISIRVEPQVKAKAESLYSQFGITLTDAVNIFLHQSLIYGGIPFNMKIDIPNATTRAAIRDVESGNTKKVTSVKALFEDLNNDDD